jgi:RNA polymerase-binding transcription factor DksA
MEIEATQATEATGDDTGDGPHDEPGAVVTLASDEESPSSEGSIDAIDIEAVDRVLDEVERALSRLDDGTYGRCETCGSPIDDARLADAPTTVTCSACEPPAPG